ncbi:unnamed protein product, partial [marine sediment metagenome]
GPFCIQPGSDQELNNTKLFHVLSDKCVYIISGDGSIHV